MSKGPVFESEPGWGGQLGKWFRNNFTRYVLPLLAAVLVIIGLTALNPSNQSVSVTTSTPSSAEAMSNDVIQQEVVSRDSYTTIARRAVTAYVEKTGETLTKGQRIFIENDLSAKIKTSALIAGMMIEVKIDDIKNSLERAKNLTASQLQKWEWYGRNIKF